MTDHPAPVPLSVMIRDREGLVYEGSIVSLTGNNQKGRFDILSLHANFITLVRNKVVVKDASGQEQEIDIKNGVLRVVENRIEIYLGFLDSHFK